MPKTDKGAEAYLKLLFWNAVVAADSGPGPDIYDNFAAGSALLKSVTAGHLVLSLHTAAPTGSSQASNEFAYTGYSRISVARAAAQWTYSTPADGGGQVVNAVAQTFGKMTGGTGGVAKFWGIGTDTGTGAGNLLYYGPLALETAKPYVLTDTTNDELIVPGHGYTQDQQVVLIDVPGGAAPTGASVDTYYYVANAVGGANADRIRLSTTTGAGNIVAISAIGSGYIARVLEKTISLNDEPKIDVGAMVVIER